MGRNSKLTEVQWEQLHKELLSGVSMGQLSKKYDIGKGRISERYGKKTETLKQLANQVVEIQESFEALSIPEQRVVTSLANDLRTISRNLAGAAANGSITSLHLSTIAARQAQKVDPENPMETQEALQAVSALTKIANESAATGMALLNVNKQSQDADKTITVVRSNVTKRLTP